MPDQAPLQVEVMSKAGWLERWGASLASLVISVVALFFSWATYYYEFIHVTESLTSIVEAKTLAQNIFEFDFVFINSGEKPEAVLGAGIFLEPLKERADGSVAGWRAPNKAVVVAPESALRVSYSIAVDAEPSRLGLPEGYRERHGLPSFVLRLEIIDSDGKRSHRDVGEIDFNGLGFGYGKPLDGSEQIELLPYSSNGSPKSSSSP